MANHAGMSPEILKIIRMNGEYPKDMWYFNAALIGLVALCNWTAWALERVSTAPSPPTYDHEKSTTRVGALNKAPSQLRRISSAIVNLFRIVAFRSTISFGGLFSINLAEMAVTCIYIIALFTWTFINCKLQLR